MQNKPLSIKEQLDYLRGMTIRLGVVHEAQVVQVKNWPLLIAGVKKAESCIDADKHQVTYKLLDVDAKQFKTGKRSTAVKGMSHVALWVQSILWPDTQVVFKYKNQEIEYPKVTNEPTSDQERRPTKKSRKHS